jgi:hypothetical protein
METHVLDSIRHVFRSIKSAGDGALTQLSLDEMQRVPAPESNSIAVIIRHLHGNMLSRWTDFLTTDGEKPTRNRDSEFDAPVAASRDELFALWEAGWTTVFAALDALRPDDLCATITIRGQAHSVVEACHRQMYHYGYHIGQIVQLAKIHRAENWQTLSIARGASAGYVPSGKHGEAQMRG